MFKIEFFIFFSLLLNRIGLLESRRSRHSVECRIFNSHFNEYLYARRITSFSAERWIALGNEMRILKQVLKTNLTSFGDFIEIDSAGLWHFEPVPKRINIFYIRNSMFTKEYLKGSEKYQEIFGRNNKEVYSALKESLNDNDEFYMWQLERIQDKNLFFIQNVKLDRLLYGRKDFFSLRSLFNPMLASVWKHEGLISEKLEQFKWSLQCREDRLPRLRDLTVNDI